MRPEEITKTNWWVDARDIHRAVMMHAPAAGSGSGTGDDIRYLALAICGEALSIDLDAGAAAKLRRVHEQHPERRSRGAAP